MNKHGLACIYRIQQKLYFHFVQMHVRGKKYSEVMKHHGKLGAYSEFESRLKKKQILLTHISVNHCLKGNFFFPIILHI